MSGHSKWANIKHRKGAQDAKRGKVFTRIGKEITISAREGGGDVDANPRLRLAVQNAKSVNMPSENVKRAIQKGTGEIEGLQYIEITYEGYAPLGVAVIVETVTDNRNRTVSEIRALFGKYGGNMGDANSVAWNFDRKSVLTVKTNNLSEDELLEHVLESGADDLEYDDDTTRIIAAPDMLSVVNKYFQEKKFEISEIKFEYIPKQTVMISNITDAKRLLKFIDIMEDYDDSQNVFSNFEISEDIIDQLDD
ncbi:MAG: YebC/PmpR family DNA-binding transcriptional regulator [Candidatus Kapabacteria bacterium]|nr:YebC/PmpR family DNA-binding transcriptional regulator [Candidatus Kapabacteria bacterium]